MIAWTFEENKKTIYAQIVSSSGWLCVKPLEFYGDEIRQEIAICSQISYQMDLAVKLPFETTFEATFERSIGASCRVKFEFRIIASRWKQQNKNPIFYEWFVGVILFINRQKNI